MIQDVAHFFFGQTLMITKLFSSMKVTVASIANECRGVVSLVLFNNVLSVDVCQRQSQTYKKWLDRMRCVFRRIYLSSANLGK